MCALPATIFVATVVTLSWEHVQILQAFDEDTAGSGCVLTPSERTDNEPPPGPEDVKHFDVLEFVKSQEDEAPTFVGGADEKEKDGDH